LSDAGIPRLDALADTAMTIDLTSPDLDEMGKTSEPIDHGAGDFASTHNKPSEEHGTSTENESPNPSIGERQALPDKESVECTEQQADLSDTDRGNAQRTDSTFGLESSSGTAPGERPTKKSRPKHKEQWDRRLLSYVRQMQKNTSESDKQENLLEHNLAVEIVARDAVCAYEKKRGRVAEQMAQTHPGYDIISRNPLTGEDRFIEVKGVNGEWNQTGVGLSRLQFSNAQDYGDRYWLYVVEFIADPEHIRVHPIQSPAAQVTAFMFDGNWRDAVTEERADPLALFMPGVRVHHKDMGFGEISDVDTRGNSKLLTILFDGKTQPTPNVSPNLHRMRIVEDEDDDNYS